MTRLVRLWWSLLERSGLRPGYATEAVGDVPNVLEPGRIYLVGDQSMPWSAALGACAAERFWAPSDTIGSGKE